MKISNTKLILFHPATLHKPPTPLQAAVPRHLWLLFLLAFFSLAFTLTRLTAPSSLPSPSSVPATLPSSVSAALLHYASANNSIPRPDSMTPKEIAALSSAILPGHLNVLIFGITHETPLFHALNFRGLTVVLDENEYAASKLEQQFEGIEAYDVQYTTKVSQSRNLIEEARSLDDSDCRPVQNLLYSECPLALNGLPNHIYDVDWDIILIDGPRGHSPVAPGRMSPVFTAAVLARSKKSKGKSTHVFVHEFGREVEKLSSAEFLCDENLVETIDGLAHYAISRSPEPNSEFCEKRQPLSPRN